jgi:hypothetical protein
MVITALFARRTHWEFRRANSAVITMRSAAH